MKRSTGVLVAGISSLLWLAACGSGTGPTSTGGEPSDGGATSTTVQWLDQWTEGNANAAIEDMIAQFEGEHPEITIERTSVPFGDLRTTLVQNVSSGAPPEIVAFDSVDTQALADEGILAPIDTYTDGWAPKEEYYEGAWASTQYEGETYGVPLFSDAAGIYANMDLLNSVGIDAIPQTWSEMKEAATGVAELGVNGVCFGTTPYESASYLILPFIWQTGGDIDDLQTSALPGLEYFAELMDEGLAPRDAIAWSWNDSMNQFLNGNCGIVFGGPWNSVDVGAAGFAAESASVPYQDSGEPASVLGGFNIGTTSGANTDAAWTVIDWFTQAEHLGNYLAERQQLPNRSDLADLGFIQADPLLPPFMDAISVAHPRAYGPNWPEMSQAVQVMLQQVVAGEATPEEAAATAAAVIEPLLQEQ